MELVRWRREGAGSGGSESRPDMKESHKSVKNWSCKEAEGDTRCWKLRCSGEGMVGGGRGGSRTGHA